ncbi:MAG: hypothetical protein KAS86_00625, partial [Candidatus Omnitrophica bacterium]|nr:hypothetical protein [Candidatus Omnitrophota bacterium]
MFARYISLYESVDIFNLYNEVELVERTVRDKLYRNNDERELYEIAVMASMLEGLYNVELSTRDLELLKSRREKYDAGKFAAFVREKCAKYGVSMEKGCDTGAMLSGLDSAIDFYETAERRDLTMIENTVQRMRAEGKRVAALITGGFHTEGLTHLMKDKGLSYLVIAPKFEKGKERPYIAVLTGRKKPYQRLLDSGRYQIAVQAYFHSDRTEDDLSRFIEIMLITSGLTGFDDKKNWEEIISEWDDLGALYAEAYETFRKANEEQWESMPDKPLEPPVFMRMLREGLEVRVINGTSIVVLDGNPVLAIKKDEDGIPRRTEITEKYKRVLAKRTAVMGMQSEAAPLIDVKAGTRTSEEGFLERMSSEIFLEGVIRSFEGGLKSKRDVKKLEQKIIARLRAKGLPAYWERIPEIRSSVESFIQKIKARVVTEESLTGPVTMGPKEVKSGKRETVKKEEQPPVITEEPSIRTTRAFGADWGEKGRSPIEVISAIGAGVIAYSLAGAVGLWPAAAMAFSPFKDSSGRFIAEELPSILQQVGVGIGIFAAIAVVVIGAVIVRHYLKVYGKKALQRDEAGKDEAKIKPVSLSKKIEIIGFILGPLLAGLIMAMLYSWFQHKEPEHEVYVLKPVQETLADRQETLSDRYEITQSPISSSTRAVRQVTWDSKTSAWVIDINVPEEEHTGPERFGQVLFDFGANSYPGGGSITFDVNAAEEFTGPIHRGNGVWIGLVRVDSEGSITYVDGSPIGGWTGHNFSDTWIPRTFTLPEGDLSNVRLIVRFDCFNRPVDGEALRIRIPAAPAAGDVTEEKTHEQDTPVAEVFEEKGVETLPAAKAGSIVIPVDSPWRLQQHASTLGAVDACYDEKSDTYIVELDLNSRESGHSQAEIFLDLLYSPPAGMPAGHADLKGQTVSVTMDIPEGFVGGWIQLFTKEDRHWGSEYGASYYVERPGKQTVTQTFNRRLSARTRLLGIKWGGKEFRGDIKVHEMQIGRAPEAAVKKQPEKKKKKTVKTRDEKVKTKPEMLISSDAPWKLQTHESTLAARDVYYDDARDGTVVNLELNRREPGNSQGEVFLELLYSNIPGLGRGYRDLYNRTATVELIVPEGFVGNTVQWFAKEDRTWGSEYGPEVRIDKAGRILISHTFKRSLTKKTRLLGLKFTGQRSFSGDIVLGKIAVSGPGKGVSTMPGEPLPVITVEKKKAEAPESLTSP